MKELGKIVIYLLAVVVLGALIAPPLFAVGQNIGALKRFEFQQFFNRSVLIAAVVLLFPLIRWLKLPGWGALGIEPDTRRWHHLAGGFLAAFLCIMVLGALLLQMGVYRMKGELPWGALGKIALTATVVSVIEELLFRGALLGLMRKALVWPWALLLNSGLFAIVHFLEPREGVIGPGDVRWWSGFRLLGEAFWQFQEPVLLLAGFSTLTLVGWILGWVTLKTRSLWVAIGLHAGWVFATMGFSKFTKRVIKANETLPWFGADLSVGLGALITVGITGLIVWLWLRRKKEAAQT